MKWPGFFGAKVWSKTKPERGLRNCANFGTISPDDRPHEKTARAVIFCMGDGHMILLHGFIKKTQKTPQADIDLALKRMKEVT